MGPTPAPTFVIALCVLPRPIPIPQPRSSRLNRFRFFLTRRNTNGREFFVLHMGHFATALEAEKWLNVLRGTYPNAYVSDTSETVQGAAPSELSDTQVLRVLEVRHPARSEERVEPAAPEAKNTRSTISPALEESLEDLAAREFETGVYESQSDTGVRHLSIEVEKKPSRSLRRSRIR